MLTKPQGYDEAQTYGEFEQLPLGGHICKVTQVKVENLEWGEVLVIAFDIAEGSKCDGYYKRNFDAQTQNKKWKGTYRVTCPVKFPETEQELKVLKNFKTVITVFEKSNHNFSWNWEEKTLIGKMFGGVFGRKEYAFDDKKGFFTTCRFIRSVEAIKKGVDIPDDLMLEKKPEFISSDTDFDNDFHLMGDDDDVPF